MSKVLMILHVRQVTIFRAITSARHVHPVVTVWRVESQTWRLAPEVHTLVMPHQLAQSAQLVTTVLMGLVWFNHVHQVIIPMKVQQVAQLVKVDTTATQQVNLTHALLVTCAQKAQVLCHCQDHAMLVITVRKVSLKQVVPLVLTLYIQLVVSLFVLLCHLVMVLLLLIILQSSAQRVSTMMNTLTQLVALNAQLDTNAQVDPAVTLSNTVNAVPTLQSPVCLFVMTALKVIIVLIQQLGLNSVLLELTRMLVSTNAPHALLVWHV